MEMLLNVFARGTCCDQFSGWNSKGEESYALQNEPDFSFINQQDCSHHRPSEWRILRGLANSGWTHTPVLVSTSMHAYIAYRDHFSSAGRSENRLWLVGYTSKENLTFEEFLNLTTYSLMSDQFGKLLPANRNITVWKGYQKWSDLDLQNQPDYKSVDYVRHHFSSFQKPLQEGGSPWIYRVAHKNGVIDPSLGDIISIAYVLYERLQQGLREGKPKRVALVIGQNTDDFGRLYTGALYNREPELQGIEEWFVAEPTLEQRVADTAWELPGPALQQRLDKWKGQQDEKSRQQREKSAAAEREDRERRFKEARQRWDQQPWYKRIRLYLDGDRRP